MELDAGMCRLRPFVPADRERLAEVADDQRIWRNLTDRFPHPYNLQHADEWIELCAQEGEPTRNFAIDLDGVLVGAISLDLFEGEKEHVGNVGYWIAADFWNRGIATHALRVLTRYAFDAFPLRRLQATVFGWNPASGRVLEKCGYRLEGRLHGAIIKADEITDELWYGLMKPDTSPTEITKS
jgi:RimJ/RimL family protein N-acetyltransferase